VVAKGDRHAGDSNQHNHRRVPFFVAGRAGGALPGGLHLKAPNGTPPANVMLTLLQKLGLDDLTSFGDSTGAFDPGAPGGAGGSGLGAGPASGEPPAVRLKPDTPY
jgi:hypothetical protein